jgi:hypothetical protein
MGQNIVQFWGGMVLILLTLSIPAVIASVMQFFLSKFKDIKYGRILLVVSFVVTTVFVVICMANGFKVAKTPIGETSLGDETLNDVKIYIS